MKSLLILILLIISASLVYANTVVKFIDGSLEIKEGSAWVELSPGDSIPNGSVLLVGENSVIELSDGKNKFSLTNPGTYHIDSIIPNNARSSKAKSLILNTIRRLFGYQLFGQPSSQTSVLGVRAGKVQDEGFSWTDDEYAEYIGAGKEYLQQEEYTKAKSSFLDAQDSAFDDLEKEEAMFYLSYVEVLSGNSVEALSLIKDYSPEYDAYYYEQAVLLKANLLIENFDTDEAISWIRTHKAQAVGVAGSLLLLEGLGNLQLGEVEKARKLFHQIIEDNSDLESAEIAAEYISSM